MAAEPVRNVVIIGGGASGALLAIHILRKVDERLRVTLIEKREEAGRGFAYGEAQPIHLLNVRAANMSAFADEPGHFLSWLDRNGAVAGVTGEGKFRFVPRTTFGSYLSEQLRTLVDAPANKGRFLHVRGEAVALRRTSSGISVTLADDRQVIGDLAVVATGYDAPRQSSLPLSRRTWVPFDPETINDADSVLVLGTGHSAIDHIQSLVAAGYRGSITAISRRGLLPTLHRPFEPEVIARDDLPCGQKMSEVWRWFRARSEAAEGRGSDWRAVLDGLRPHVQTLWLSLAQAEKRRFVRHARAWWDVRRHRMAPSVAASLQHLRDSGALTVIAAKVVSATHLGKSSGTAEVVYRRRGAIRNEALRVQAIIDCTGFSIDVDKSSNPIVRSLLDQGLARPDPLALGFEVSTSCALIGRDGAAASDLFAVGPLTRGTFWETVGVPDIRLQCAHLADHLSRSALAVARVAVSEALPQ